MTKTNASFNQASTAIDPKSQQARKSTKEKYNELKSMYNDLQLKYNQALAANNGSAEDILIPPSISRAHINSSGNSQVITQTQATDVKSSLSSLSGPATGTSAS